MDPKEKEKKFAGKKGPRVAKERGKDSKSFKGRKNSLPPLKDKPYIGPNDINWRTSDDTMAKLVANLPFGLAAGLSQEVDTNPFATITYPINTYRQPGILAIATKITAGATSNYNSALNLAIRKVYSFVRHANSGSKNYEAADMGMYFVAVGQILALLGWLQRLLSVVDQYSPTNRYLPRSLCQAMAVDFDDVIANQPQLKYLVAWLGRVVGSLAFPDMPYFHACYEAYKWIIRDNDSPKEQFYVLTSKMFGIYNPTYDSNGGGISYQGTLPWALPTSTTYMKVQDLYNYAKERTDVLLGDEDIGIISGDILKAFRDSGLFVPAAFSDYDPFIKSDEELQQIHNANILDSALYDVVGYKQNPGAINTAPFIELDESTPDNGTAGENIYDYLVLDAFSRDPDYKEVVNCTVLNPTCTLKLNSSTNKYAVMAGSAHFDLHLPQNIYIIHDITGNGLSVTDFTQYFRRYGLIFHTGSVTVDTLKITNFDWHPFIIRGAISGYQDLYVVGDIQNFRIFGNDVSQRIHENSMLSLLNFKELNFVKG